MMYGIVLKEKHGIDGLKSKEIIEMMPLLGDSEVYPIEIEAKVEEASAMGFISQEAAGVFDYDYENSGLNDFIALILDELCDEAEKNEYEFQGIKIWIYREE